MIQAGPVPEITKNYRKKLFGGPIDRYMSARISQVVTPFKKNLPWPRLI